MIRAITFDFWDTLAVDDSDEFHRAEKGLLSKPKARYQEIKGCLQAEHPHLTDDQIQAAFDHANEAFRVQWKKHFKTPSVADRFQVVLDELKISQPENWPKAIEAIENMEVDTPPDPTAGTIDMIPQLAAKFSLGIISDTIHTPGRGLKKILQSWGILEHFQVFIFSDEVGHSKPSPEVFQLAAKGFGCRPSEMVHIGDRESNDVEGPAQVEMKSLLYTGAIDRGSKNSRATQVYSDHLRLPEILAELGNV